MRASVATRVLPMAGLIAGAGVAAGTAVGLRRFLRAAWGIPSAMGASWGPPALWRRSRREIAIAAAGCPQFDGEVFHNALPSSVLSPHGATSLVRGMLRHGRTGKPAGPVPLVPVETLRPPAELAVTWLGHASCLIELDGFRVLADPVWSDRVSPSKTIGPQRLHPVPMSLEALPVVDAVIISHDHYDHLDLPSIRILLATQDAPFLVPVGVGVHLLGWGVPRDRVIELDWNASHQIGELTITSTQARHFSGRGFKRNTTLWSSWALVGPRHRVYFGGDTGYTPVFAEIGARIGPFDLTILPIGAYGEQWPDIHMNPEEAWRAHGDLGGSLLVPIHWATFDLALHTWAEPVERLLVASGGTGVAVPRPGQRIDTRSPAAVDFWWRAIA